MLKPKIMAEIGLSFDKAVRMQSISEYIELIPSRITEHENSKVIVNSHTIATWVLCTEYIETFYSEEAYQQLLAVIAPKADKIKSVIERYNAKVDFCIVTEFNSSNIPAITF